MKIGTTITLAALTVIIVLLELPKKVANSLGFAYKREFKVNDRTVKRPESFVTIAQRRAFEEVGKYLSSDDGSGVLWPFDDHILQLDSADGRHKISLKIWHEVLRIFAKAGVIEAGWRLRLPMADGYHFIPGWDRRGEPLPAPKTGFELLNDRQRYELLGKPYALYLNTRIGNGQQKFITLGSEHFTKVYIRSREVSGASLKNGHAENRQLFRPWNIGQ